MLLKDCVAVVTGAAGGLGKAIAQRFAREGAHVVLCDINEAGLSAVAAEIAAIGGESFIQRCDVSSSEQVDAMFDAVDQRFGTTHILINNAGLVPDQPADVVRRNRQYAMLTQPLPRASLEITKTMSDTEWKRFWAVNVDGVFYNTRAALRRMETQRYGRIVNVASIAAISAGSAHSPHYSAAKGAVIAFTRSVAYEVAGANVLVNCICPGGIATPTFSAYIDTLSAEQQNSLWQIIPIGRLGQPAEYAALVTHLASAECYCVGSIINVSGGAVI